MNYEIAREQQNIKACEKKIQILRYFLSDMCKLKTGNEQIIPYKYYESIRDSIGTIINDYDKAQKNFYKTTMAIKEKIDKHIKKNKLYDWELDYEKELPNSIRAISAIPGMDIKAVNEVVVAYNLKDRLELVNGNSISFLVNEIKALCDSMNNSLEKLNFLNNNKVVKATSRENIEELEKPLEVKIDSDKTKDINSLEINELQNNDILEEPETELFDINAIKNNNNLDEQIKLFLNGPQKKKMFSKKDPNLDSIAMLYAFSVDMFLMFIEEYPKLVNNSRGEQRNLLNENYYLTESDQIRIYDKYGVSSFGQLWSLYTNVRENYYSMYQKLNSETKRNYAISNIDINKINVFGNKDSVNGLKAMDFSFPPSSDELKAMFNKKTINYSKSYPGIVHTRDEKDKLRDYESILNDNEQRLSEKYGKLTEYMNVDQVTALYKSVCEDLEEHKKYRHNPEEIKEDNIEFQIITNVFAQIIFHREGKKYNGQEQYNKVINEIKEKYLGVKTEEVHLTEEEQVKREKTLHEDYLIYYKNLPDKSKKMSLADFAKRKYGINMFIPESLEEQVEEELSSMKR